MKKGILDLANEHDINIYKSFLLNIGNYDCQFDCSFIKASAIAENGKLFACYCQDNEDLLVYPFIVRDIRALEPFSHLKENYFDAITPFEYGGILLSHEDAIEKFKKVFHNTLTRFYRSLPVINEFIRFNPFAMDPTIFSFIYELRKVNDNIYIDTTIPEDVFLENVAHSVRKNYKRAQMSGLIFEEVSPAPDNIEIFFEIYSLTMNQLKASKFYHLPMEYFNALLINFDKAHLFFIKDRRNKKIVASSIVVCNKSVAHHHLTGSRTECLNQRPNDLMLISLVKWCNKRGIKKLHLGGGPKSIRSFKKKFSSLTIPYYIGYKIWNQPAYRMLIELRFGKNTAKDFIPAYREGL